MANPACLRPERAKQDAGGIEEAVGISLEVAHLPVAAGAKPGAESVGAAGRFGAADAGKREAERAATLEDFIGVLINWRHDACQWYPAAGRARA